MWICSPLFAEPVKVIIDTDFDTDVDDVGALALAHAYADAGGVEILGVAIAGLHEGSAAAVHSLNSYYGRPGIPIGVRRGKGVMRDSKFTAMLVEKFPAPFEREKALDAVALYRKILAGAEDGSVTVVSLGYLSNLADLLDSGGDGFSPLNGMDLVAKKVSRYVCMGGAYPRQSKTGSWGNFLPDPPAVKKVNDDWPTQVVYTGGEEFSRMVMTGRPFIEDLPEGSLIHDAYKLFFAKSGWAKGPTHHSADLIAVHVAMKGCEPYFKETKEGHSHIFEDATMEWRTDTDDPKRSYVAKFAEGMEGETVARKFNELIVGVEMKALGK